MTAELIVIEFENATQLIDEFEKNLKDGGTFARGVVNLEAQQPCFVSLVHPITMEQMQFSARVVWLPPLGQEAGVGVAFEDFDREKREYLRAFVYADIQSPTRTAPVVVPSQSVETHVRPTGIVVETEPLVSVVPIPMSNQGSKIDPIVDLPPQAIIDNPPPSTAAEAEAEAIAVSDEPEATDSSNDEPKDEEVVADRAESVHDRLRGLTLAQQLAVARTGEINERIVLERIYGKSVWEALLRNSRVTVAEVSRIAKMGNLPRPLVDLVVSNNQWLTNSQVRRALLTNPRISPDGILKVLRAVPRAELKLIPKQTAYPMKVRTAAKKLFT